MRKYVHKNYFTLTIVELWKLKNSIQHVCFASFTSATFCKMCFWCWGIDTDGSGRLAQKQGRRIV